MLNRVSGCIGLEFPRLARQWGFLTPIALAAGMVACWDISGATALEGPAWKAEVWDAEAIYRGATIAQDLAFPDAAGTIDQLASARMALIKPAGSGPFPAIVLMHQCTGLNRAVATWAGAAVSHGYVVLLVDSLGPRNVKSVCFGPRNGRSEFLSGSQGCSASRGTSSSTNICRQEMCGVRRLLLGSNGRIARREPPLRQRIEV
jgi:hypothetical protein